MTASQKKTYDNKIIWIIGASSGIGEALSKELASRGAIMCLSARRGEELEKLRLCLSGEKHTIFPLNVCDKDTVMKTAHSIHSHFGRIDSIIFLAAAYHPMRLEALDIDAVRQIIETNFLSAFYVLHAVIPLLKNQSYGQIALCGSVAGYMGLPGGQPYSATKAAIINLTESLRSELPSTIDVKIFNPGFVKTELTRKNNFEMPMIITPAKAATFIADGLLRKNFEIHFPRKFTLFLKLLRIIPYWLSTKIVARLNVR
jgi:NADP-dependent 3-hydroxy acid dehydrogenase YdfG